ncbi:MAG TPA: DUF485 domain-containing protein [Alphaproteobacteria bacterium]|nr:DUF485 domain-containing protein [Alphaproteobacteria bacterium]
MPEHVYRRILADPRYHDMVARRSRIAWLLSAVMLGIYFAFILVIAFAPRLLATPLAGGVTTVGIPLGLAVIFSAFVLTGIYVRIANSRFDALNRDIVREAQS